MALDKPEATCRICSKPITFMDHPNCHSIIRALKSLRTVSKNTKIKISKEIFDEYLGEVLKHD